jgi:hypothetical protein
MFKNIKDSSEIVAFISAEQLAVHSKSHQKVRFTKAATVHTFDNTRDSCVCYTCGEEFDNPRDTVRHRKHAHQYRHKHSSLRICSRTDSRRIEWCV